MIGGAERGLRLYFLLCVAAVVFAYGVAVGMFKIFPYALLETLAAAGQDWIKYPKHNARLVPEKFLTLAGPAARTVVRYQKGEAYPGQTFITGFFGDSTGMRLIDMQGRVLHEWRVSFNAIWPNAAHLGKQPGDWDMQIHGALPYPNGDVIFNYQYVGLARIDRCGRVLWKLPRQTHHSVFEDAQGMLWVPSRQLRERPVEKFANVPAPFYEEYLLRVTPQGKVLQEISVLDVIYGSQYEGALFANGDHHARLAMPLDHDFTHLNDIEVLPPGMAAAFPMFTAGDVLVSLRNLNFLFVMDARARRLKWAMTGPFLRQHDPDFLPSGHISVFDNRRDGHDGAVFGGSRILKIDPANGTTAVLYGRDGREPLYTETMGDHQFLPNGNLLITESQAGHAFEITPAGKTVWSYVNHWNEKFVAQIERATRYPENYLDAAAMKRCL